MTVSSEVKRITYAGNGSTTVFTVPFYFLAEAHLAVYILSALGIETVQVLNTDYTVSGVGAAAGGAITMTTAPATGETLIIIRGIPFTQLKDYVENDSFPAESHEQALDKATMLLQQQQEELDRSIKFKISANDNGVTLPSLSGEAGNALVVNATEDGFELDSVLELAPLKYYIDPAAVDQGLSSAKSMKYYLDLIGSSRKAVLVFTHNGVANTTTYTINTNIGPTSNITLEFEDGAIVNGTATLTMYGQLVANDQTCIFGPDITVLFGVHSTKEIHPEWWGLFPNGSDDTAILNKAIAASDIVGSASGYEDASIIVKQGRYKLTHNSLSTIKTNFIAPLAMFDIISNTVVTGTIFQFDFTEYTNNQNRIQIGNIVHKDLQLDVSHYNIGINILGGDNCRMIIGGLYGLAYGIRSYGTTHEKHVGMWNIDTDIILSCDTGILLQSGTTGGTDARCEGNQINVRYMAYCDIAVSLDSNHANAMPVTANVININALEMHHFANYQGFYLNGSNTFSNVCSIPGALIPSATCYYANIANSARENIIKFCRMDLARVVNSSGGYNIFKETYNHNHMSTDLSLTNDYGRSELMLAAAPTTLKWRVGDRVWNNSPDDGVLGWVCIGDGTPGTWTEINLGPPRENILINQDFSIWQENTTFTNPASGDYTADGYYIEKADGGGTAPSVNVKKNTSVHEDAFEQCCELEITNVGVTGATRHWRKVQKIKDYKKYKGKTVTFSIRIKSSVAITLPNGLIQVDDGVAPSNISITSVGTTWTTYSATLTVSNSATHLITYFYLVGIAAGAISTTGSIYIQWMKLEEGVVNTPIVPKSQEETLRECLPFYQKSYVIDSFAGAGPGALGSEYHASDGHSSSNHTVYKSVAFPVRMSGLPAITLYDDAGNLGKVTMAAGDNITGTVSYPGDSGFLVTGTNGAVSTSRVLGFHWVAIKRP